MASIPNGYVPLDRSKRVLLRKGQLQGPADPSESVSITVRLRRRTDTRPLPDLNQLSNSPSRPDHGPRRRFAETYGAHPGDVDLLAAFATLHHLKVESVSLMRRTVMLSGTTAQFCHAFAVDLHRYELDGAVFRVREGPIYVPESLLDVIEGVFGLDNRRMARRSSGGAPGFSVLTPLDVARLYNFPSADASRQTIALIEFGGGYRIDKNGVATDVEKFFTQSGIPAPRLTPVPVDGAANLPDDPQSIEVLLDIEVAGSVAPNVNIAVYFAPWTEQGWVDAISWAVAADGLPADWPAPSVISISWGWPELATFGDLSWTEAAVEAISSSFQDAAMLNVSVFVASGDTGTDCGVDDGKAHVNYPASDPWVTACGGTSILNVNGTQFDEITWNDNGITGGGISSLFAVPPWQAPYNIPPAIDDGHVGRGIPDIAGYANGYKIVIDGKTIDGGYPYGVPGTSEAAPLYAGLVAVVNAMVGEPIGFLNPLLYRYGTQVFRDIADGGSNATGISPGYTATAGWDACTGWGSLQGHNFLTLAQTRAITPLLAGFV